MLYRFPPSTLQPFDSTFLTGKTEPFAKLKIESKAGKRTVFLTQHTMLFVIKGVKLLHFASQSLRVGPNNIVLLRKGVYVMAEYIEEGLNFEALLLFMPPKLLRSLAIHQPPVPKAIAPLEPYIVLPANELTQGFVYQLRLYFNRSWQDFDQLLSVKQQEILLLLLSSGYRGQLMQFIHHAVGTGLDELDFVVRTHLFQPVSLPDLANLSNRSLTTFKRDFQRCYQCAPRQWINRQRLAQAHLLVENTKQRIDEIAQVCGFESTSYLIRLFKKEYGYTPTALRAKRATK